MHIDGYLCEIKDVQIRDGLHILGGGPEAEAARQPRAGRAARLAGVGRAGERAAGSAGLPRRALRAGREGAARRAGGAGEGAGRADGAGRRARPDGRRRDRPAGAAVPAARGGHGGARLGRRPTCRGARAARCWAPNCPDAVARAGVRLRRRSCRGWPVRRTRSTTSCGRWTAATSRPGPPARRRAGWSTSCRPAATSTPSTPRPFRPGCRWEVGQALADSLVAALPGGHRRVPEVGRSDGLGHVRDAHPGRRHRRDPGAAGLPPGLGRRVAPGHRLRGRAGRRSWAGRAST